MKEIKFYLLDEMNKTDEQKEEDILGIEYNSKKLLIFLNKEDEPDINNLYDFIIENIKEINFINNLPAKDKTQTIDAAQAIFDAINSEASEIKKVKLEFNKIIEN